MACAELGVNGERGGTHLSSIGSSIVAVTILIDPTTVLSVVTSRRRAPQGPVEARPDAADRHHELRHSHGFPYNRCWAHD